MKNRPFVYAYILAVTAAAVAVGAVAWERMPIGSDELLPLVCFTLFLFGVNLFEIRSARGIVIMPSATLDVAVMATLGPAAVMIMEAVGNLIGEGVVKRRPPIRLLYNTSATVLSAGIAGLVFHALPFSEDLTSVGFLVPAMAAALVLTGVSNALLGGVVAISEGRGLIEAWQSAFGWQYLAGLLTAPLSAFLIFSYEYAGIWSLTLFAIPIFTVWQASKMFEQMKEAHKNTVSALTTALEADEPYTHGHSYRVAQYSLAIGKRMGMGTTDLETLEYAGLLHDIGKIAITNDIVCKPARLTKEEFDILSAHPAIGGEIVAKMKFLDEAAELVRHHHERPDGQGYPDGLRGDEIKLGSHILNLADAIDAMCSNRPYRAALSLDQCLAEVKRFRGLQFDERVVDCFEGMIEDGSFQVIGQADGSAQEIQRILREAAGPYLLSQEPQGSAA